MGLLNVTPENDKTVVATAAVVLKKPCAEENCELDAPKIVDSCIVPEACTTAPAVALSEDPVMLPTKEVTVLPN